MVERQRLLEHAFRRAKASGRAAGNPRIESHRLRNGCCAAARNAALREVILPLRRGFAGVRDRERVARRGLGQSCAQVGEWGSGTLTIRYPTRFTEPADPTPVFPLSRGTRARCSAKPEICRSHRRRCSLGVTGRGAILQARAAGLPFARSRMPATILFGTGSNRKGSIEYAARPFERERMAVA